VPEPDPEPPTTPDDPATADAAGPRPALS
jgi:hypothetical protein